MCRFISIMDNIWLDRPGKAGCTHGKLDGRPPVPAQARYAAEAPAPTRLEPDPSSGRPARSASLPRVGISHRFLTDLPDDTGLWHLRRTPGFDLRISPWYRLARRRNGGKIGGGTARDVVSSLVAA